MMIDDLSRVKKPVCSVSFDQIVSTDLGWTVMGLIIH